MDFSKAHKIFQGYLKLYSNYMNIIQIQIANELNPKQLVIGLIQMAQNN